MQISKTEYKTTELGETPADWAVVKLESLCSIRNIRNNGTAKTETYIGLEHIGQGTNLLISKGNVKDFISTKNTFLKGDILYGKLRPLLNKVFLAEENGYCSTDILPLAVNNKILNKILLWNLSSERFVKYADSNSSGTKMPRTSWNDMKNFLVAIPSIKEQQKIASVISNIDGLMQKTKQIIEQIVRLKNGLMQRIFTKGRGSTNLKFNFVRLGDYVEVKGRIGWRGLRREEYTENGPYMISGYNLINRRIIWNECLHLSNFRYEESPEIQLKLNDIIMVKDGVTLGRLGFIDYLPGPTTINSTMVLIREISGTFHPEFLFYYFQGPLFQNIIKERVSGLAVPHIFQRDIKELKIPSLEMNQQKRIALTLAKLDKYYEKQMELSNTYKTLKKASIQKLLSGKLRVKV